MTIQEDRGEQKNLVDHKVPQEMKSLPSRGVNSSTMVWMKEKAQRDQQLWHSSSPYWICENKMYDLTQFVDKHPGGESWIRLTRGQDITEHFIVHHLREGKARQILSKYYIGDCPKQVTRFTFGEDGFYRTLKHRVLQKYSVQELQDETTSKIHAVIILICWIACLLGALYYQSLVLSIVCGPLMVGLVGVGHNFVHHKESVFRYFLLLVGFTHREWQIMHCISHHEYPNTQLDYQNAAFEPFGYYLRSLPPNKQFYQLVIEFLFFFLQPINMLLKLLVVPVIKRTSPDLYYCFPLIVIAGAYWMHGDIWVALKLYLVIYGFFGFLLMKVLFCGHRVQDTWTEGAERISDYGLHTIYASSDTDPWIQGLISYVLLAGFNIHAVHHLFPTVDHHMLPKIHQMMVDLCRQRGIKRNQKTRIQCIKSLYKGFMNRPKFDRQRLSS